MKREKITNARMYVEKGNFWTLLVGIHTYSYGQHKSNLCLHNFMKDPNSHKEMKI